MWSYVNDNKSLMKESAKTGSKLRQNELETRPKIGNLALIFGWKSFEPGFPFGILSRSSVHPTGSLATNFALQRRGEPEVRSSTQPSYGRPLWAVSRIGNGVQATPARADRDTWKRLGAQGLQAGHGHDGRGGARARTAFFSVLESRWESKDGEPRQTIGFENMAGARCAWHSLRLDAISAREMGARPDSGRFGQRH